MAFRLAASTGRFLLAAATGLWKLCTCCTVTTCEQVYLVYECGQDFDPVTCAVGTTRYWICTDRVVTEDGGKDPLDLTTLDGTSGVLTSASLAGCWYIDTEHGPIDYADIPPGVTQLPPDAVGVPAVSCEDAPCEPNYDGACDCLCYERDLDDNYCCWGRKNFDGNARFVFTYTGAVTRTLTSTPTVWAGVFPGCTDCEGAGTTCTDIAYVEETYGDPSLQACDACYSTRVVTTIDRQGCCGNDNVADPDNPVASGSLCWSDLYDGFDGPDLPADDYDVYATLEGCENSLRYEYTLSNTPCGGWELIEVITEKIYISVFDGPTEHCGCESVSVKTTVQTFDWDAPTLDTAELRLCGMCELSLMA